MDEEIEVFAKQLECGCKRLTHSGFLFRCELHQLRFTQADLDAAVAEANARAEEYYRYAFPNCVDNDHCRSRREHGDGTCGCGHDSIAMALAEKEFQPTTRLWTKGQLDAAVAEAVRAERDKYVLDGARSCTSCDGAGFTNHGATKCHCDSGSIILYRSKKP